MQEIEIVDFLKFLQNNYLIINGYYYSNNHLESQINNIENGNQITHEEIKRKYIESKKQ